MLKDTLEFSILHFTLQFKYKCKISIERLWQPPPLGLSLFNYRCFFTKQKFRILQRVKEDTVWIPLFEKIEDVSSIYLFLNTALDTDIGKRIQCATKFFDFNYEKKN